MSRSRANRLEPHRVRSPASSRRRRRPGPAAVPRAPDLLEIDNLEVVYDDVVLVLRGVSFAVPKGAIVTLLGPNGAGKSTTLKSISGLLKAENGEIVAGDIRFDGRSIAHSLADRIVRRGIFQVMEGRRIIGDMTVLDNLRAGAHSRGATARSRAISTASMPISRASGSATGLPATFPAASSRCWRSAAP